VFGARAIWGGLSGGEVSVRIRDWVWVYLATGDSFTRWALLLFYGAVSGAIVVALGLVAVLAFVMADS